MIDVQKVAAVIAEAMQKYSPDQPRAANGQFGSGGGENEELATGHEAHADMHNQMQEEHSLAARQATADDKEHLALRHSNAAAAHEKAARANRFAARVLRSSYSDHSAQSRAASTAARLTGRAEHLSERTPV